MTDLTSLIPMTIRVESIVSEALAEAASAAGRETADYAADVLAAHVLKDIRKTAPDTAARIQAEIEIKGEAVKIARGFVAGDPARDHSDVTLRTFQAIRANARLDAIYRRAIGGRDPFEAGNPIKAGLNRSIGATVKTAVGATVRKKNGKPEKMQVGGEYMFSYTALIVPKAA